MDPLTKETLLAQIGGEAVPGQANRFGGLPRPRCRGNGTGHARKEQFDCPGDSFDGRRRYQGKHWLKDVRVMRAHVPISAGDAEGRLVPVNRAVAEMRLSGPPAKTITGTAKPDRRNNQPQTMGKKP